MQDNFHFQPPISVANEIAKIDWDRLSLEEIIAILDRLGIGFAETLKLLLSKLKPGQKAQLMNLVQAAAIGNKQKHFKTQVVVSTIKQDPKIPNIFKLILNLLAWRADKKHGLTAMDNFASQPAQDFAPAFAR